MARVGGDAPVVPKGDGTLQILPGVLQHKLLTLQTHGNLLMEMMQAAQSLQLNHPANAPLLPLRAYSY